MSDRGYKRSWKNLLINKRYQLRFTLFMVGLAAVLMGLLGWWVVRVASEATTVAQSSIRGDVCPPLPKLPGQAAAAPVAPAPVAPDPVPAPPAAGSGTDTGSGAGTGSATGTGSGSATGTGSATGRGSGSATGSGSAAGSGSGSDTGSATDNGAPDEDPADPGATERRRAVVIQVSKIDMEEVPPPPVAVIAPDHVQQIAAHHDCELRRQARIDEIGGGRTRIVLVMIAAGLLLTFGLAVFGIKMTHRVAGPLFKVTLYLAKMRDGRYDKVYDLRRGDQLVEFYEHFKHAHAGIVAMEQADVERIRAALDAATADGVLERSDEAKAAAAALRDVLARKEKSLVG